MTEQLAKNYLLALRKFFMVFLTKDRIAQHEVGQAIDDLMELLNKP